MNDGASLPVAASLFGALERIAERPEVYSRYTGDALWSSPDISEMLLRFHLDGAVDVASRRSEFVDASIEWLVSTFELGPGKRVIDLGCGPGLYTNRLAQTGTAVTGVDISPRSIEHAQAEASRLGVEVEYRLADYLTLEVEDDGGFDLATMIMCDFCALSPEQRTTLLKRVKALLVPGGAFLLDVYSAALFDTWEEQSAFGKGLMDDFWSASPYYGFLGTFTYPERQVVLEKYVIVERDGVTEYLNWFQHYDRASLTAELEANGLEVDQVLGDVAGADFDPAAAEFAVIARTPAG